MFKRAVITIDALASRRSVQKVVLLLGLAGLVCATATAANIAVFSTGNGITTDGTVDPHWTYTSSTNNTAGAFIANSNGPDFWNGSCCGGGPWTPDTSSSSWIVDDNLGPASGGDPLSFQTTFSLAGLNPSTASISLMWGVDDGGNLLLNGNVVSSLPGQNAANWDALTSVTLNSGFLAGANTLSVVLTSNDNNFEGANVRITSATANPASAVPEPTSIGLLGSGLLILLGACRRRLIPG